MTLVSLVVGISLMSALWLGIAPPLPLSRPSRVRAIAAFLHAIPTSFRTEPPVFEDELRPMVKELEKLGHDDIAVALMWAIALKAVDPEQLELALMSVVSLDSQRAMFRRRSLSGEALAARFADRNTRKLRGWEGR